MEAVKRVYAVSHKREHKMFRVPADIVKCGSRYTCEETKTGVRFLLCKDGPYKVIGEANNPKGLPRYGNIAFVDEGWNFGDKYFIEAVEGGFDIIRKLD